MGHLKQIINFKTKNKIKKHINKSIKNIKIK